MATSKKTPAQSTTKKSAKATPSPKPAAEKSKSNATELQVGDKAPSFSLLDDAGKKTSLSDFKGKTVVLYFYPKDSTPGCTVEACDFRDNLARLNKAKAVVLGMSADSVESHQKFKSKQELNFGLLSDPDKSTLAAYGVWQEKSNYGRKFMGIVRTTFIIGPDGKITHVFPKVRVAGHVDAILSALG